VNCRDCTREIFPRTSRRGGLRHAGRGLCRMCWWYRDQDGTLDDVERVKFTRDELMTEWDILRGEGYSKRQAAERIGVTYECFDRAYCRARAAGDPRAYVPGWSTPPVVATDRAAA
jgi:hypothetical protein